MKMLKYMTLAILVMAGLSIKGACEKRCASIPKIRKSSNKSQVDNQKQHQTDIEKFQQDLAQLTRDQDENFRKGEEIKSAQEKMCNAIADAAKQELASLEQEMLAKKVVFEEALSRMRMLNANKKDMVEVNLK